MKLLILLFLSVIPLIASAQLQKGSTIRGQVIDKISRAPLIGANVVIVDSTKITGSSTDISGNFRLDNVPVGRLKIKVSYIGYRDMYLSVMTHTAKELVLLPEMEESVSTTGEVTVHAKKQKDAAVNKMSAVSARMFTIEETNRYAGSMNDPSRMTKNFAGVMGSDETRNDIIIRGNSPSGLLWRLDDVDIPNPNHFSSQGTSGGLMSILNNNTLANSDFMSGAFNAEYMNALSGVFDLKMKSGNNEKHEQTAEFSINGLELGLEGPFSKKHKSSYLVHYRYANFKIIDAIVDLGISGVPSFQDISLKFCFPLEKGVISIFGIAGTSNLAMDNKEADTTDYTFDGTRQDLYIGSDMAASAVTYTLPVRQASRVKFILSGFSEKVRNRIDTIDNNETPVVFYQDYSANQRVSAKFIFSSKFSSKLSTRAGATAEKMMFNLNSFIYISSLNDYQTIISDKILFAKGPVLTSAYNQWMYKFSDNFSCNAGAGSLFFSLNEKFSIEPRAGITWDVNNLNRLSFGYGLHSHLQPVITYYCKTFQPDGNYRQTNLDLDFSRAHHFVISHNIRLSENMRLKSELYYQYLFKIPVESRPSAFSMINVNPLNIDYEDLVHDSLTNDGTGENHGVEITLEKFFSKGYYYLFTASLFESKYKGSDGITRNTVFNGNYIFNFLIGKEFKIAENWLLVTDFKATCGGGKRYTPVDLQQSILTGKTVLVESETNSKLFDVYYKGDIKIGFRHEGRHISQEFAINADNFTNRKNGFRVTYNKMKKSVETQEQLGILPGIYYRVYF